MQALLQCATGLTKPLLLVVAMGVCAGCGAETPAEPVRAVGPGIVGLWECLEQSQGGLCKYMEFRADGTVHSGICAMVEFGYRIEGDRLHLAFEEGGREKPSAQQVEFVGDEMLARPIGADGTPLSEQMLRKRRLTPRVQGTSPLVGDWRYEHYTGGNAYERYTPAGRMLLRVPMATPEQETRYRVLDGVIELTSGGSALQRMPFTREGDELRVTQEGNPASRYRFVPGGAWYAPPDAAAIRRILEASQKLQGTK